MNSLKENKANSKSFFKNELIRSQTRNFFSESTRFKLIYRKERIALKIGFFSSLEEEKEISIIAVYRNDRS